MQLAFEKWSREEITSPKAKNLFAESFLCYKAGANRAALLFSYVAFMDVLKERLAKATPPAGWDEARAKQHLGELHNENKWEETVFNATQNNKDAFFPIDEHIRLQIRYWKDRRNDAAHYKDNEINENHVELFWAFVRSNLYKMRIGGSMRSLVNKFLVFYDSTQTGPGESIIPLIDEIRQTIQPLSFVEFIEDLFSFDNLLLLEEDEFYWSCMKQLPEVYGNLLQQYLLDHPHKLDSVVNKFPKILQHLTLQKQDIRKLWKRSGSDLALIYVAPVMLKLGLIPADEIEELMQKIVKKSKGIPANEEDRELLKKHGYYEIWKEEKTYKLHTYGYSSINDMTPVIIDFMEHNDLSEELIDKIINQVGFKGTHPYSLANALPKLFENHPDKKKAFNKRLKAVKAEVAELFTKRLKL